jgi:hypothetical protein
MIGLKDILYAWKQQYGAKVPGKLNYYMPFGSRVLALFHLINTLKTKYDYTRECFTIDVQNEIIASCLYGREDNLEKRRRFKLAIDNDLQKAINKYYPLHISFIEESMENISEGSEPRDSIQPQGLADTLKTTFRSPLLSMIYKN